MTPTTPRDRAAARRPPRWSWMGRAPCSGSARPRRRLRGGQSRDHRGRGQPRHRRRLQPLSSGRGRHRRRVASGQARRGVEGQGTGDRVDAVSRRLRRHHPGDQPQEQLRQVADGRAAQEALGAGSQVKTWKDVDPSWPDRKIILYSPDNDSGTFEFFTEAIVGKAKSQREDVQQSSDDNTLVSGVANDEDGMGYFGYAYYAANKERLRAVAVQNGPDAKPRAAQSRDDRRQIVQAALAALVHLCQELGRAAARGQAVPQVLPGKRPEARGQGRIRSADRGRAEGEPGDAGQALAGTAARQPRRPARSQPPPASDPRHPSAGRRLARSLSGLDGEPI